MIRQCPIPSISRIALVHLLEKRCAVRLAILISICLAFPVASFSQTTWYVDDDAPNDPGPNDPSISDPLEDGSSGHPFDMIQEGIDTAANGDTVLVASGSYTESIKIIGKHITVRSASGPDVTIIDGNQSRVVTVLDSVDSTALEGFTITNGIATNGGGVYCHNSSIIIDNNIITSNTASGGMAYGGGIYIESCSAHIVDNIIKNNSAVINFLSGGGGGIACWYSEVNIFSNFISDNITTHTAGDATHGGGIALIRSKTKIVNNIISGNQTNFSGGGIYAYSYVTSCVIALENNTITNNTSSSMGGGFYVNAFPHCYNTIFCNNTAPTGSEIYIYDSGSILTIDFSNIEGGKSSVYKYPGTMVDWGSGMIFENPCFINPAANDFHLTGRSPCINMGTNDGTPDKDVEGNPRCFMGTTDMGAYEFTGTHALESDVFVLTGAGGNVNFSLDAGPGNAGRTYLLLGSISGTAPGFYLPGNKNILHLNWDILTEIIAVIVNPSSPVFVDFYGTLDSLGKATAAVDTNGPIPGVINLTASFAYPLEGPPYPWDFASNPVNIDIVP